MLRHFKAAAKYYFAPILYRYPPIGMQSPELGIYLWELLSHTNVPGDVAEIGCSAGGTACLAGSLIKACAPEKSYTCFDTFGGFIGQQLEADLKRGTPQSVRRLFADNSVQLVRRILDMHGCEHVKLVEGDIVTIPDEFLSDHYSVVLCDVDLAEPTYLALKRFFPRLSDGGVILVDDCRQVPGQRWKAFLGFQQFCEEENMFPQMHYGFGIIRKPGN